MCASEIGCISVIPLRFVHVTSRAGSAFCLITACRSAVWTDRCLTAHPLRDVWVVFSFRLLRMKLPCTSLYKFLCENRFNLSGINAQLPATAGSRGESVLSAKDLPAESQGGGRVCATRSLRVLAGRCYSCFPRADAAGLRTLCQSRSLKVLFCDFFLEVSWFYVLHLSP